MKSIMQDEKVCYICGTPYGLEDHHVFNGNPNRKYSEKYGLKVWLCNEHHTGNHGVHRDYDAMKWLKQEGQKVFEKEYGTREEFMRIFGRSWL